MEHSNRYKLAGLMALCLFIVPLLGWWTGQFAETRYERQFRDFVVNERKEITGQEFDARRFGYITFCKSARADGRNAEADKFCSYADEIEYVKLASAATGILIRNEAKPAQQKAQKAANFGQPGIVGHQIAHQLHQMLGPAGLLVADTFVGLASFPIRTGIVGLALFILILAGRILAGTDRRRMSLVFGSLVRVVMLLLAISVLAQGALFVYSIYTIEAMAIQRVHGGVLLAVGFGALAACWVLLKSSLALLKREPMFIRGIALDRQRHHGLFAFVESIAIKLNAIMPDNIIAGLEPNFFVTASDVKLIGQDVVS